VLKRISVSELRVGMYIDELCGSWMEHPFWRTRFALKEANDVRRIAESGIQHVWIDTDKGLDADCAGIARPNARRGRSRGRAQAAAVGCRGAGGGGATGPSFAEELERALSVCARARPAVLSMFSEARMGRAIGSETACDLVDEIFQSVAAQFGRVDQPVAPETRRRLHVHALGRRMRLMIALCKQLGLSHVETREAGLGGLMHDVGKAKIPDRILRKPDKLTDDEWVKMKAHPEIGHSIMSQGNLRADPDGRGAAPPREDRRHRVSARPRRRLDQRVCEDASVCDVYDAVTSNRPYKNRLVAGRGDPQAGRVGPRAFR